MPKRMRDIGRNVAFSANVRNKCQSKRPNRFRYRSRTQSHQNLFYYERPSKLVISLMNSTSNALILIKNNKKSKAINCLLHNFHGFMKSGHHIRVKSSSV